MDTVVIFAIMGIIITKVIDFLRNAFDKEDRIPKAWWNLAAFALGIGLAYAVCGVAFVHSKLGLPDEGCTDQVLIGLGFGAVSGFWHELLDALGGAPAATPKGLLPRKGE